jgi:hypothetical protein
MKKIFVYKVWSKVLGVEEFESIGSFSKLFRLIVLSPRKTFYEKNFFFDFFVKNLIEGDRGWGMRIRSQSFQYSFFHDFLWKNAKKNFFDFFWKSWPKIVEDGKFELEVSLLLFTI